MRYFIFEFLLAVTNLFQSEKRGETTRPVDDKTAAITAVRVDEV